MSLSVRRSTPAPGSTSSRKCRLPVKMASTFASAIPIKRINPGENLILPQDPGFIIAEDFDLDRLRRSYLKKTIAKAGSSKNLTERDFEFLAEDVKKDVTYIKAAIQELNI